MPDLWQRYCASLEQDMSEQRDKSIKLRDQFFERWKKGATASSLASKFNVEIQKFDDVPLTDYPDYSALIDFGKHVNKMVSERKRGKDELWWDYYNAIFNELIPAFSEWLTEPFGLAAKTSGTFGESKWLIHGKTVWENLRVTACRFALISGSDSWGETKVKKGDRLLNILAPIPYIAGYYAWVGREFFRPIPPVEITDNITDIRRKLMVTFKEIEKAGGIDCGPGVASFFYLAVSYFENPQKFYWETCRSLNFGIAKMYMLLKYLQARIERERKSIRELFPVKGLVISGIDTSLYYPLFEKFFNIKPLNAYASTELGGVMSGIPDRKELLMPYLDLFYPEFLDSQGEIWQIDQLKKGQVYECVGTPFGSTICRYKTGDLFKVVSFRDDGMPLLAFESRRNTRLSIYGYFILTEAMAVEALRRAGLTISDKWAFAKMFSPDEHLHLIMEKEWEYSEEEATKKLFNTFYSMSEDFRSYVQDFRVKKAADIFKVEYVRKGAFLRYFHRRVKEGVPPGQVKPPKLIPPERMDIFEILRRI